MKTTVVNLREEYYDIRIGRGTIYGNPFTHENLLETKAIVKCSSRSQAVDNYRLWVLNIIEIKGMKPPTVEQIRLLKGKVLGCYCQKNASCHGQVLAEIADSTDEQLEKIKEKLFNFSGNIVSKDIF